MKVSLITCMNLLLAAVFTPAQAMEIRIEGDRAYLSGDADFPDSRRLEDAFKRGVKTLVFEGNGGGRVAALLALSKLVTKAGVSTVAIGPCAGACSYLFLGGQQRYFAAALPGKEPTALYVRGARLASGGTGPSRSPHPYAFFRAHLAEAVPSRLLSRYTSEWKEGSALVFLAPSETAQQGEVLECAKSTDVKSCQPVSGLTLINSGVLTSAEPYSL